MLSLHDALPIYWLSGQNAGNPAASAPPSAFAGRAQRGSFRRNQNPEPRRRDYLMKKNVELIMHPTGVAEIIVDRPERHNAMTLPMYEDVLALIEQSTTNLGAGCILFRGTGGDR